MSRKKAKQQLVQKPAVKQPDNIIAQIESRTESWQGPVPHPAALEHYEKILPGMAERVLTMAEEEQEHRHLIEQETVKSLDTDQKSARKTEQTGLVLAFLTVLALCGSAVLCAFIGHPSVALAFVGTTLLGIVRSFIRGRPDQKKK
jgi:uncharacterized membrane protein